jgi:uncharacterized protein
MGGVAQLDQFVAPITTWAGSRSDIVGLAVVGSWARGAAPPDSDIDLVLLTVEPETFRCDELWLAEIPWSERRIVGWYDAEYGTVWSRHVQFEPPCEIEFTFCALAATDPIDRGTARVVSGGLRVLLDKARLFEDLLAKVLP